MGTRLARAIRAVAFLFAAATIAAQPAPRQSAVLLTVFAAADLGPPFKVLAPLFERETGARLTVVLGSTGMLAQQIRNGAPADVFFAADESFVAALESEALTRPGTRLVYGRGRLVMAVPVSSLHTRLELQSLSSPAIRRVAIANPQHAPYGRAARQALQAADLWDTVTPKLVFGENIQQAAQFVRTGAVEAGIIARSVADAPELRWQLIDDSLHSPLNQAAAVLARSPNPLAARAFIEFVIGASGRGVMRQFGFQLPGEAF